MGEDRGKRKLTGKGSPRRHGPTRGWWRWQRGSKVNGGAREDVEVRGTDKEPVVAKPGANGGQIWWPVWRRFLVGEVDGVLTDGGSRSSSRWSSCVGSRNRGICVEAVLEQWQPCWHGGGGGGEGVPVTAACEGKKNLPSDSGQKAGPKFIVSIINNGSTWNRCWILYIKSGSLVEPLSIFQYQ
jgi:hypothetical protein